MRKNSRLYRILFSMTPRAAGKRTRLGFGMRLRLFRYYSIRKSGSLSIFRRCRLRLHRINGTCLRCWNNANTNHDPFGIYSVAVGSTCHGDSFSMLVGIAVSFDFPVAFCTDNIGLMYHGSSYQSHLALSVREIYQHVSASHHVD